MLFNSLEFLFFYLPVLLGSIVFNYLVGYALVRGDDVGSVRRKRLLWLGVSGDLALLGYYMQIAREAMILIAHIVSLTQVPTVCSRK